MAVLLSAAAGCQTGHPPTAAPADAATRWHQLGEWSGRGNRQTESFEVTTGAMRLTWETRGGESASGDGRLRISLHSAISGRSLQTIVDVRGVGGSTVNIEDDPRTSYLEIESDNVEWRVRLEEVVVTTAARP
jgi:hypothetical protein